MTDFMIPGQGRTPVIDYNEINLLETDNVKRDKLEFWIAKNIGSKLMEVYPNRQWSVIANVEGRLLVICCPSVSQTQGYHIDMGSLTIKELQRRAILAAGEILERYGLERGRNFDPAKIETLARDAITDEALSPDAKGGNPLKVNHD